MYLRFTGPGRVTRAHVRPGLFRSAYELGLNEAEDTPSYLALRQELDWFSEWLPIPRRFTVVAKGKCWSDGICWFRDDAREMLEHAFTLAVLLEELGVPITYVWSRDPGQILYRDRWQIVAKPEGLMLQ